MAQDINKVDISEEMLNADYFLASIDGKLRRFKKKDLLKALLQKSGGTMAGAINMDGNAITGIPDAEEDTDALALAFAKTLFAPSGLVSHIIEDPSSDSDLDAQLKAIFDGMPNDTVEYCAMRSAGATTTFGGGRVTFEIFKQVGGYGVINATKYYEGTQVREQQRLIFNNSWHSWDWVNPPMRLGGEYRTTERYGDAVVYAKQIYFGQLPTKGSWKSVDIGVPYNKIVRIIGKAVDIKNFAAENFPLVYDGAVGASFYVDHYGKIFIGSYHEKMVQFEASFIIYYSK